MAKCGQLYKYIDNDQISECYRGDLGTKLLLDAGKYTKTLNPQLHYVPWIIINNKHTDRMQQEAEQDLVKYLCQNYGFKNQKANGPC